MLKLSRVVVASTLMATGGCGGKGDDCQRFWDRTSGLMQKMAGGKTMPADAKDQFLKQCRDGDKLKKDPVFRCVLDASGESAISDCMTKAFGDYASKSKQTEAQLSLNKLSKNLKVAFITDAAFPAGKVGPTPAESCCKGDHGKCSTNEWETNEMWRTLEFMMAEPHLFQYAYESDGKTVTATATGDLDCDGTTITYTLEMSSGPDGQVESKLTPPAPNAD